MHKLRRVSLLLLDLAAVGDGHLRSGLAVAGAESLDLLDDVVALRHLAEHGVLAVQPGGQHGGDEELWEKRENVSTCALKNVEDSGNGLPSHELLFIE
jgi:hypothetical protein